MSKFQNNAIFWVEVERIVPNPYQPRREFNQDRLQDLAESIRQYGVLQPLVVTKNELYEEDGMRVEYELIAGERRHRASKIAGLTHVPVLIRSGEEDAQVKLELAIIENLQREDLNPIERAQAFSRLADEFNFTHAEIAEKVGKSREYVSNSIRLLKLPDYISRSVERGEITEGHARPLMMLRDKPEEQETLYKEVKIKKMTVRDTEKAARRIAKDKVRKKSKSLSPRIRKFEEKLSETLGTRVHIEAREVGGKIIIDYFSDDDIEAILQMMASDQAQGKNALLRRYMESRQDTNTEALEQTQNTELQMTPDEANQRETNTEEKMVSTAEAGGSEHSPQRNKSHDQAPLNPDLSTNDVDMNTSREELDKANNYPDEDREEQEGSAAEESSDDSEDELYAIDRFTI